MTHNALKEIRDIKEINLKSQRNEEIKRDFGESKKYENQPKKSQPIVTRRPYRRKIEQGNRTNSKNTNSRSVPEIKKKKSFETRN